MLILLDIDGVMVPGASWKVPEVLNDGFPNFSHKAISSLRKILSETSASLMLTTSHKSNYSIPQWKAIFEKRGIQASIKKLPDNHHSLNRKDEILHWMQTHPTDDSFIIIDDDTSLNDLPHHLKQKLLLTSPLIGLNDSIAGEAIKRLKQYAELVLA